MNAAYPHSHNSSQPPHPGSQPTPMPLAVWGATDTGRQREGNEDAIFPHSGVDTFSFKPSPAHLAQQGQLLVVADGVGGAQGGREASHWAIRVAVERYYDMSGADLGSNLRTAIEVANSSLYQYIQSTGVRESGCTMAAAVIHGNTLHVANVGDSRVYLLRGGQITRLTRDHTLAQQKADQGIIQPEQVDTDSGSHVLTRSMGANQTVQVDLFPPLQLVPGDVVLLCSDGLTDMLKDAEIARVIGANPPRRAAQRLIAAANRSGGVDNISVVLARAGEKQPADGAGIIGRLLERTKQQRITIAVIAAITVLVFFVAVIALAWMARDRSSTTPSPITPATAILSTEMTVPAVASDTPHPTAAGATPQIQSTSTPRPTNTPTPSPTSDSEGPLTATPRTFQIEPILPVSGATYKNPVAFEWRGSLQKDQTYQIRLYHIESEHTISSEPLTDPSWVADLPADKYGGWRWQVLVIQDGKIVGASQEWMFWFNPGGGGGDGGSKPTAPPTRP
jgi:serine/threonine protein phosphatase PrpC